MNKPNLSPKLLKWLLLHAGFSFFSWGNPQTPSPYFTTVTFILKIVCASHLYPLPSTYGDGQGYFSLFRALVIVPPCGDKLMVTTLLLGPPFATESLTRVRGPMLYPLHLPGIEGTQKVIAMHLSSAIPGLSPWMHMTGALLSCWD